jgi:hypothetical protein
MSGKRIGQERGDGPMMVANRLIPIVLGRFAMRDGRNADGLGSDAGRRRPIAP